MPTLRTQPNRRWGVGDAVVALAVVALLLGVLRWVSVPEPWLSLAGTFVVLLPLAGAVLIASYARGLRSLVRDFGLRFTPIDLLIGIVVGLALRSVVNITQFAIDGYVVTAAPTVGVPIDKGCWLFLVVLAPVVIAPVVEELFFRGLLQQALSVKLPAAVVISATVFALVHLASGYSSIAILMIFVVGLVLGTVTARSGRLGGAITAHIVFNGSLIFMMGLS